MEHRPPKPRRETAAYRWSRVIQHRPWPFAIGATALLLVLAIPFLSLRLGFSDESNFAEDTTTKQAYNLIVEGFGEGSTGPIYLVAEVDGADQAARARRGQRRGRRRSRRSSSVLGPQPNDPTSPTAVRWIVTPDSGPQDEETTRARQPPARRDPARRWRRRRAPTCSSPASSPPTSTCRDYMAERMPIFFGAVLALSFLLLMVVFRSLLVPLKAVIMNLLSIAAAYGVIVALFQWGWGSDITDVQPGPIEAWAPMMLFAVVFGLSMDYEVFLLSRIREEWHRTGDSRTSVADGLAATAKVITAAAAIMVVVFGSFMLEFERTHEADGHRARGGDPLRRHDRPHGPRARRRWSCSATATGGCRAGSTGSCRTSTSRATPSPPRRPTTRTRSRKRELRRDVTAHGTLIAESLRLEHAARGRSADGHAR